LTAPTISQRLWLSQALSAEALTVAGVSFERIGTGQMGATYRLCLSYQGSESPATLVAKTAGDDEASRASVAPGYAAEVGFYTELATSLDVRTPRCWYGAIAADNSRCTLLLDDVSPAPPGIQADGCTAEQASAALRNLIGLHAPTWNDPRLRNMRFLLRPDRATAAMVPQIMSTATEDFIRRFAGQLDDGDAQTLRGVAAAIEPWQLAAPARFSLIHGDYRLDNLLFDSGTGQVTVVDWQTAAIAPPLRDVAYFLGTCLQSDDRRSNEGELLREYHGALIDRGVTDYGAHQCWNDYRLGQLQGPMVSVMGYRYAVAARTEKSDAMFLAMARRSCTAVRELRSLDLM
jgi:hypothetical protein